MKSQQPALIDPAAPVVQSEQSGLIQMIERMTLSPDVPVDKLERLLVMQERVMAKNAESAFNGEFALMAAEIPTIVERGKTDKGKYARFEDIVEGVRPILSQHGFSLSFRTEWPDKATVKVVGILTHREGHSRCSEFMANADTSGSKNAIQALGSAVSYGRRYTTRDLLNIASKDEDDDGYKAGKAVAPEPPKGYAEWLEGLEDVALEGLARLQVTFQQSNRTFREYLTKHDTAKHIALKAAAAKVTPTVQS